MLLSRFELTAQQASTLYVQEKRVKAGIEATDSHVLENPYLLYDLTRLGTEPIRVTTVDRGLFPDAVVRDRHPVPERSGLDTETDERRVRAFSVKVVEDAAVDGNTLLPQPGSVARAARRCKCSCV
jgi:hypothetical protein